MDHFELYIFRAGTSNRKHVFHYSKINIESGEICLALEHKSETIGTF